MNKALLVAVCVLLTLSLAAQTHVDSTHTESVQLAEQLLIQQQQQKKIDSLLMNKLQNEMQLATDNSKQKRDLEKQLKQLTLRDSLRQAEQLSKIELLRKTAKGYPVTLLKDTLFYIFTRLGSFDAATRASAVTTRIANLYEQDFFSSDSLQLSPGENGYDITYKRDLIIISISDIDALYFNESAQQLAANYLQIIGKTINNERAENSVVNWLKRLAFVLLVIAGIFLIIYIINRFFRYIVRYFISRKEKYFKGITIRSFSLFKPKEHLRFFLRVLRVLRIVTILFALYLSLPILFSIFPQTKAYTYTLLNWIISPAKAVVHSLINYLPNLFTIVVIYLFTSYAIKAVRYVASEIEAGNLKLNGFYSDWAKPTYNIIKFLLYAFMLIVIFPYLPGSGSPAFQGVSVFLGVLFSLGSSSAISNIVAGLVITYMRPFKVGDRVKIGEVTGDVLEKTMLVTRIKTIKNEEITVPNATVLSGYTVNYTTGAQSDGLIVHTTVTIGYNVPWKDMHAALIKAALQTDKILNEPAPFVLQTALQDFYVSYQLNAYTKSPEAQANIYSQLHQNIQDCCYEAGIEIMSPHYNAMRDGNSAAIPKEYLPEDYIAPGFNIHQTGNEKSS